MAPPSTGGSDALDIRLAELRPGLDLIEIPACVIDQELRYRYANGDYAEYFGKVPGDFIEPKGVVKTDEGQEVQAAVEEGV